MASPLRWKIAQKTELKWWKNYLKSKDKTDYLNWKRNYWNALLQQVDTILKNADKPIFTSQINLAVLDAGCGPAGVNMVLSQHQVDAFDPLLDKYRKNISQFDIENYPWGQFEINTLEAFNAQAKYDAVFCMNALNHVQDIEKSTRNLKTALKLGGIFIATLDTHNYAFFKHLFKAIPGDVLHPHQYNLNEYESLFKQFGLQPIGKHLIKRGVLFDHWLVVCSL